MMKKILTYVCCGTLIVAMQTVAYATYVPASKTSVATAQVAIVANSVIGGISTANNIAGILPDGPRIEGLVSLMSFSPSDAFLVYSGGYIKMVSSNIKLSVKVNTANFSNLSSTANYANISGTANNLAIGAKINHVLFGSWATSNVSVSQMVTTNYKNAVTFNARVALTNQTYVGGVRFGKLSTANLGVNPIGKNQNLLVVTSTGNIRTVATGNLNISATYANLSGTANNLAVGAKLNNVSLGRLSTANIVGNASVGRQNLLVVTSTGNIRSIATSNLIVNYASTSGTANNLARNAKLNNVALGRLSTANIVGNASVGRQNLLVVTSTGNIRTIATGNLNISATYANTSGTANNLAVGAKLNNVNLGRLSTANIVGNASVGRQNLLVVTSTGNIRTVATGNLNISATYANTSGTANNLAVGAKLNNVSLGRLSTASVTITATTPTNSLVVYNKTTGVATLISTKNLTVGYASIANNLAGNGAGVLITGTSQPVAIANSFNKYAIQLKDSRTMLSGDWSGVVAISQTGSPPAPYNPVLLGFFLGEERRGSVRCDISYLKYYGNSMVSNGADYAEYLERLDHGEPIQKGDVVGVIGDKITRQLTGAQKVMIVSTEPGMVGNNKGGEEDWFERIANPVAFLGQVPVRVLGKVKAGDWIIPSGHDDGTAIAVSKEALTLGQASQVLGQAWEGSEIDTEKKINVAIASHEEALHYVIAKQQSDIDTLKSELNSLKDIVNKLTTKNL